MPLIAVTLAGVSAGDKTRIQACWFPLLKSETITVASEVTDASLKTYFDALITSRILDCEKRDYTNAFSYTSPTL